MPRHPAHPLGFTTVAVDAYTASRKGAVMTDQSHPWRPVSHRRIVNRMAVLLVCLSAVAVAAAGCSSPQALSATSTPSTPGAVPQTNPVTQSREPSGPPTSTDTAPTRATASNTDICRAISESLSVLATAASSPDNPTLQEGVDRIRQLAGQAPPDIKGDLTVIADFDQSVVDRVRTGKAPEINETPELTAAMSHEATWTATHCQAT